MFVSLRSSAKSETMIVMRLSSSLLAAAMLLLPIAAPATAQRSERVLTIFGQDKCPADTICVVAPERDRYRIPKALRGPSVLPENQSWAARSESTLNTGRTGTGSCSAVGAGGWTGCYLAEMKKARAEAKAAAAEKRNVP
jgi:hypothetical protein